MSRKQASRGYLSSALWKDTRRTILRSKSRFLAIFAMTALGALVFVGLKSTPPIMRRTIEDKIDQVNMEDMTISSPLGLYEEDQKLIDSLPGVHSVEYRYSGDYFMDRNDQLVHLISLPDSISSPMLLEGRLPRRDDEILLDVKARDHGGYTLQDKITLSVTIPEDENGAQKPTPSDSVEAPNTAPSAAVSSEAFSAAEDGLDVRLPEDPIEGDELTQRVFTIVGFANDIHYLSKSRGTAALGDGELDYFGFVLRSAFSKKRPDEAVLDMTAFDGKRTYESAYRDLEVATAEQLQQLFQNRPDQIHQDIKGDALISIENGQKKIEEAKQKLEDAKTDLDDARSELNTGWDEYRDGEKAFRAQIGDAAAQLAENQKKLDDARAEWETGQKEYLAGEQVYQENEQKLIDTREKLDAAKKELDANQAQLEAAKQLLAAMGITEETLAQKKAELAAARAQLEKALQQLQDAYAALPLPKETMEAQLAEMLTNRPILLANIEQAKTALTDAQTALDALPAQLEALNHAIAEAQAARDALQQQIDALNALIVDPENPPAGVPEQIAALTAQRDELDAQLQALQEQKQELEATQSQLQNTVAVLPGEIAQLEANLVTLDETIASLQGGLAAYAQLDTQNEALQQTLAQLEAGEAQLQAAEEGLRAIAAEKEYYEGLAQYNDGLNKLQDARKKLDDAKKKLDDGLAQYNDGIRQLNDGKQTLAKSQTEGQAKLDNTYQKLLDGEQAYTDGLKEYLEERPKAEKKIADGEQSLADARLELDKIRIPSYTVTGRHQQYTISTYLDEADSLNAMSYIFPTIFYLIALLVSLTTMTRMVDEERSQIGTLKALGYRRNQIVRKYLTYGVLSSFFGTIAGVILGLSILTPTVYDAYSSALSIPGSMTFEFRPLYALIALGISLGVTLLAAWFSVASSLREKTAELMRPKPPAKGNRILLERIPFIWSHLSFMRKVTLRNVTAKKSRMFMTILGVTGCSGLIAMGFGIQDSINGIFDKQFEMIERYDLQILYNSSSDKAQLDEIDALLKGKTEGVSYAYMSTGTFVNQKRMSEQFQLYVPMDAEDFSAVMTLQHRRDRSPVKLSDEGAVFTEKMYDGLQAADHPSVSIKDKDGYEFMIPVADQTENYVQHRMFMTPTLYERIFHNTAEANVQLVNLRRDVDETALISELLQKDAVISVFSMGDTSSLVRDLVQSLNLVVFVIIMISSMLAFVVLFNLTNLNVSERLRELSTIKVLGFRSLEVTEYIYRESWLLTLIGIFFGFFAGKGMHLAICVALSPSAIMLDPELRILSYVISAVVTGAFSLLVMFLVHRRLKHVDMVEALKAVE
ncbi:MAG: FtsX-like permease family protein [Ndongobacter sp.]|nr:FtsX-like permease family protein [Ndongobacter sp.]